MAESGAAEILRAARVRCVSAPRKAMLIRIARAAAGRLQALLDPAL